MKRHVRHLILVCLTAHLLHAQTINFPDPYFQEALVNHDPVIDTNGDLQIQQSEALAFDGFMNISGTEMEPGDIADLTGIGAFENLQGLICDYNQITQLDLSSNTQLSLVFSVGNPLQTVDLSQNTQLDYLTILHHELNNLELGGSPNMTTLVCVDGPLQSVNVGAKPLMHTLYLQDNQLSQLDLAQAPALTFIRADGNQLASLDLQANLSLRRLFLTGNMLSQLDLSNNPDLIAVDIRSNMPLTTLNLQNGTNTQLDISGEPNSSNFQELPALQTVCLDDPVSPLADYIQGQTTQTVAFTQDCTLGTPEPDSDWLLVTPNPVGDWLYLASTLPVGRVEVYDITGKLLHDQESHQAIRAIHLGKLKTGLYLLRFTTRDKRTAVKRIIHNY